MSVVDTKVLVLNRSFLPINTTTVRRAFCMVVSGVARIVDSQYRMFDFPSWAALSVEAENEKDVIGLVDRFIRVPRVIVLMTYDRLPRREVRFSRHNIYARDNNTCQYCGEKKPRSELNLDHVIPRSQGGRTTWENVVCSCLECNRKKGGRRPEEAGMKLLKKPTRPKWNSAFIPSLGDVMYRAWMPFLNIIDLSYWNVELEEG